MLAIVVYFHRQFGVMARAVWLFQTEGLKYNIEFIDESSGKKYGVSEKLNPLILVSDKNADSKLHAKFGVRKFSTIREFLSKVPATDIEKLIRPHVEKVNASLILHAVNENIPVFFKELPNIVKGDILEIRSKEIDFEFSFMIKGDGLSYSLRLLENTKEVNLLGKEIVVVSNTPAVFILEKKLYLVEAIGSSQIKIFTTKRTVEVPQRVLKTYFETFILKILTHYDAKASGFDIITKHIKPKVRIVVKEGISQTFEIEPYFIYNQVKISPDMDKSRYVIGTVDGMNVLRYTRDLTFESKLLAELNGAGLRRISGSVYAPNSQYHSIFSWISSHNNLLKAFNIEVELPSEMKNIFIGQIEPDFAVRKNVDWFEIEGTIRIGEYEVPILKLKKYILNGIREIELPNGQLFYLPDELFAQLNPLFEAGRVFNDKILVNRFHGDLLLHSGFEVSPDDITNIDSDEKLETLLPPKMPITLRDYQLKGFQWLVNLQKCGVGGILADDMGLGKTLQTIVLLVYFYNNQTKSKKESLTKNVQLGLFDEPALTACPLAPSLIVVPASLTENWKNEIGRFAPSLKVLTYVGQQRFNYLKNFTDYHIVISSYGTIRNDLDRLSSIEFEYLIFDESQMVKNPESATYAAVSSLNGKYKMTLTGTPVENSLIDLWAQLELINPGYLLPLQKFKSKFVFEIEKFGNVERSAELQKLIAPFVLRRTKKEVARELPPKHEQTVLCAMTEEQEKLYVENLSIVRNEYLKLLDSESALAKPTIFALKELMNLRLLANDPRIAGHTEFDSSGKYLVVTSHLDELYAEKHKVLIFSSFVRNLSLYQDYCKGSGYPFLALTGSTQQKDRHFIINEFQSNPNIPFFFISLKSGGFGLNLQVADYVMLLDPWWNPQAENQAIDRAHRIGQEKHVHVFRYITKDTVEEKIQILQERKRLLSDQIIENNSLLKSFDAEELKKLLS